jgi:hypothetical protein
VPERINSSLESEGGVVAHTACPLWATTPSAPLRRLRNILLMAQPPLLTRRGFALASDFMSKASGLAPPFPLIWTAVTQEVSISVRYLFLITVGIGTKPVKVNF